MSKKITFYFLAFMLLIVSATKAQLSGTYTIGGVTPNYATFTDARNDLNLQGVSGPVIFNVRSGVYNEQVLFGAVTGASATNTITFQSEVGDSTAAVIEFASNNSVQFNYTVALSGADYFTFSKLTIRRVGSNTSARALDIGGGSDYNVFTNCVLNNEITVGVGPNQCVVYSNPGTTDLSNTFNQNRIENGYYGLLYNGNPSVALYETGTVISNNLFVNQYQRAMFFLYQNGINITGNSVSTTSTYKLFGGIRLANSNGLFTISKNKINCSGGGYGVDLELCTGDTSTGTLLSNNFVSVGGDSLAYGISITTSSNITLYYNSVNITSNDAANGHALHFEYSATGNISGITVMNNNLVNSLSGYSVYMYNLQKTIIKNMDYNNLYSKSGNVGYYYFTVCNNLANWKTTSGLDVNSQSFDPQFVSAFDLHSAPFVVNDFATPLATVSDDIDGEVRNAFTPDIGADEYSAFAEDIGARVILSPVDFDCVPDSAFITVTIKNYGFNDQTNFDIHSEITGSITNSQVITYTDTLHAGETDTVTFLNPIYTSGTSNILVTVFTSLTTDMYLINDSVIKSFTLYTKPHDPFMQVPVPQPACPNQPVSLDGTVDPGLDIAFYDVPSGGTPTHIGHPWVTSFASSTTVYAEARDTSYVISNDDSLGTFNTGGNGSGANFFDVTNISATPITVHYLSTLIAGVQTATVYYLPGGLTSCTSNPVIGNFTMVGSASVVGLGGAGSPFTFIPVDLNTTIPPGQTYAFCISSPSITYTNGTGTGTCPVFASNSDISIHEGFGGTTTGPIANRRLNGRVSYSKEGGGCPSARVAVPINIATPPVVNLGNDTVLCNGSSLTLDAGSGFVSYLWSDGSSNSSLTVSTSGTYWVEVSNGICSTTDSIFVNAISCTAPTASFSSSDTVFCEKNCLNFTDLSVGATSWNWTFTGASPSTSTLQNPAGICYNNYGTYDIILKVCNNYGCDSINLTSFITVVKNPIDSIYFSNDTLYSLPAYSYQWYQTPGGPIPGATNQYFIASNPGSYYCVINDSIGCVATSNTLVATGIADMNFNTFAVYPNPNDGTFEILLGDKIQLDNCECRIMDAYGKLVYISKLNQRNSIIHLKVSSGIYFVEIQTTDKKFREKFMVK